MHFFLLVSDTKHAKKKRLLFVLGGCMAADNTIYVLHM